MLLHSHDAIMSQQVPDHCLCVMSQIENLDDLVGQVLPVKFLEIEQERDRLVFSARKASNDRDMKTFSVSAASGAVLSSCCCRACIVSSAC